MNVSGKENNKQKFLKALRLQDKECTGPLPLNIQQVAHFTVQNGASLHLLLAYLKPSSVVSELSAVQILACS